MKKKLLTIILASTLALVACGGSETTESDADTTNVESSDVSEETAKSEETTADDGIIDFEADSFKVTYTRHETGTDYEGNPCLLYYYNFTNNGEEATSAMAASYIQCFQNGVECDVAILMDENEGINNSMKDIQPGTTLEVCNAYVLGDTSEVTLEASDWVSVSGDKDVQVITLE